MRDLLGAFDRWAPAGRRAALARVVVADGPSGHRPGAALAIDEHGEVAGDLDHPAVLDAAVAAAGAVLRGDGRSTTVTDGTVEVVVAPADWAVLVPLAVALRRGRDVALAVQIRGPAVGAAMLVGGHGRLAGSLGHERLDAVASPDVLASLALRRTATFHYGPGGERCGRDVAVFAESFNRPPRLVVLGTSGTTGALVRVASAAGFRVTVWDPRPGFATAARYPEAVSVVAAPAGSDGLRALGQLGPRDAVCAMGRDGAAVAAGLGTRAGYLVVLDAAPAPASPEATAVALCADLVAHCGGSGPPPPPPSFQPIR